MSVRLDDYFEKIFSKDAFVRNICRPLERLYIHGFYLMRVYDDNTFIDLTVDNPWSRFFFNQLFQEIYTVEDFMELIYRDRDWYLWTPSEENSIIQDGVSYGFENGIVLYEKFSNYIQLAGFYSEKTCNAVTQMLINNLNVLRSFVDYFIGESQDIINSINRKRILLPQKYQIFSPIEYSKEGSLDFLSKKFFLGQSYGNRYLSYREIVTLQWLLAGKSAEEVAIILGISKRTVEAHIANMKKKLDCCKLSQLIHKATVLNIHELVTSV